MTTLSPLPTLSLSRRSLLRLGAAALLAPRAASAQVAGRVYRLGYMMSTARSEPVRAPYFEELSRNGFIEGKNLVFVGASAVTPGNADEVAAELVKAGVD